MGTNIHWLPPRYDAPEDADRNVGLAVSDDDLHGVYIVDRDRLDRGGIAAAITAYVPRDLLFSMVGGWILSQRIRELEGIEPADIIEREARRAR